MRQAELNHYRDLLLDLRPRLNSDIQESIEAVAEEVHVPGEDTKEPSEGLDKELALERTQEEIWNAVNSALDRIEAGTYGRCAECGKAIARERLEALPYTPYCIGCEREREAA